MMQLNFFRRFFHFKKNLFTIFIIYILSVSIRSINYYNSYNAYEKDTINKYEYYIKFNASKSSALSLDKDSVFLYDFSKSKSLGVNNQKASYPITIGRRAIICYQNNELDLFIKQANWFIRNADKNGAWQVPFDKKIGTKVLKSPWPSAMSQGLGISVLVRAYMLTQDTTYIIVARKAMTTFYHNTTVGGVVSKLADGSIFYEEYPLKEKPKHVLNGFIYSLFGLYDLYRFDDNKEAKILFDQGILTLTKNLELFSNDYWTFYSLDENRNLKNHWGYSSPWYQKLHVAQMKGLYLITKNHIFEEFQKKWELQRDSSCVNFIIYPAYVIYTDFVKIYRFVK